MSSLTATTITRNGVTQFSDWAVGNEVGPTAVTNLHTQTSTANPTLLIPLLAILLNPPHQRVALVGKKFNFCQKLNFLPRRPVRR